MTYTIWSSSINLEDWEDFLEEEAIDADDIDTMYERIAEVNDMYLDDEKANCDIEVPEGLVIFGEASSWDGRHSGILSVDETNIGECFKYWGRDWQDVDIRVDDDNNLIIIGRHHDGTDIYTVRKWKSAEIKENDIDALNDGEKYPVDVYDDTESVGDLIKAVYGWK